MIKRKGALETTHEILERFEAHLRASGQLTVGQVSCAALVLHLSPAFNCLHLRWQVTANMRGNSAEEVAEKILSQSSLSGLQV